MNRPILQKIALLNQTTLDSLVISDFTEIFGNFIETGLDILEADFGFAWLKSSDEENYRLVYKSKNTPYDPKPPREKGGNFESKKNRRPFFVEKVRKEDYEEGFDVSPYMKSYAIIPITYKDHVYGSLVICYKSEQSFTEDASELAVSLGNAAAQSVVINRLIAKERRACMEANRQEEHFKALVENSSEIIMLLDRQGIIRYVSSSVERVCGIEPEDVIGHRGREFIYNCDISGLARYMKTIIEKPNIPHVREYDYKRKDGSISCFEATAFNMLDNPSVAGIVVNIRDITAKKRSQTLKETQRLLKEEQQKTEFIANTTHEIRTPLAIIRGNADLALMENDCLPRSVVKSLKAINNEIEHLSNIIADLTLLTSNKVMLNDGVILKKIDLGKIIASAVKRCKALASKKNIVISAKIGQGIELMGDETYLEKMFLNLIRNAVNYGKADGWIRIETLVNGDIAMIKVADNGIGISREDLPNIFNRFYRVDKSHSRDGSSTGLGLTIVKWIVESHHGSIGVQSNLGAGTTFIVSLPILKEY